MYTVLFQSIAKNFVLFVILLTVMIKVAYIVYSPVQDCMFTL